jgi:hypothetical protein
MSGNAGAPRNGTLRREDTLPLANQPRWKAARVPLSGGRVFGIRRSANHSQMGLKMLSMRMSW